MLVVWGGFVGFTLIVIREYSRFFSDKNITKISWSLKVLTIIAVLSLVFAFWFTNEGQHFLKPRNAIDITVFEQRADKVNSRPAPETQVSSTSTLEQITEDRLEVLKEENEDAIEDFLKLKDKD